jgi:VCBS repeat-containing protein
MPTIPVDSDSATNVVVKRAATNTTVGLTVSSSDPGGSPVTYSLLGDTTGGGFKVDPNTGVVSVADPSKLTFANSWNGSGAFYIFVQASDDHSSSGLSFRIDLAPDLAPTTPTDSDTADNLVAERAVADTPVGLTVSASDPEGAPVTYSLLGDTTGGGFKIDANTGVVSVADPSKVTLANSWNGSGAFYVFVQASDGDNSSTQCFRINTDLTPGTPTDSNAAVNLVAEQAAANALVGLTVSAADPEGVPLTYAIVGDTSSGGFKIDSNTGVVSVADPSKLTFANSWNGSGAFYIFVQASDGHSSSGLTFRIDLNLAPTTPTDGNAGDNLVLEGAAANTPVGLTASSSDPEGVPVTYSLVGDSSGGGFKINAATGAVSVADPSKINYETAAGHAYTVTVAASDGASTTSQSFSIGVADVAPSIPVDVNGAPETVVEGAAAGTPVGITASSTDINGPAVTYSLISDTSNGGFAIDSATGQITVADASKIDYESAAGHAYSVTAQASDGTLASSKTFSIAVTDVAPSTPIDSDSAANSIAEGAANGSTVGLTALSIDPNGPAAIYSLTDNAGGRFAINSATGVVTVANGALLDYETSAAHAYNITVQGTAGALSSTQTFTIDVTNVAPSSPGDSDPASETVSEGAALNTTVGITATSTDPNGPAVTWSIVSDTSSGGFKIGPSSGIVSVADPTKIDYETAPGLGHSYVVTVQASDGQGGTTTRPFTIVVNDVAPQVPQDINGPAGGNVTEAAAVDTTVGITASSTDVNGPAVTWSITADSSGGGFKIDSAGVVSVADASKINYENAPGLNHSYDITVQASDGQGGTSSQVFNILVANLNPTTPTEVADGTAGGSVLEAAAADTLVGITASSSDPNGPAVSWSITADSSGGGFKIGSNGAVSVADPTKINYENAPGVNHSYDITVQASDGQGGTSSSVFNILVGNVNPSTPSDGDSTNNAVGIQGKIEEGGTGGPVGITAVSSDPNGPAVTWSILSGSASGAFQINSTTGVVSVLNGALLNYETAPLIGAGPARGHTILVQGSDGAGGTSTQTFTIEVTNLAPAAPSDTDPVGDGVGTIKGVANFDATAGTLVGIHAQSTGDPAGGTVSYELAAGSSPFFQINSGTGEVSVSAAGEGNLVAGTDYDISVVAKDTTGLASGTSTATPFKIHISTPAPAAPADADTATANQVTEDATGTHGNFATSAYTGIQAQSPTATSYSISADTSGGGFQIDPSTGKIYVDNGSLIDYESAPGQKYTVTVVASDGAQTSSSSFDIGVIDVAPTTPVDADASAGVLADPVQGRVAFNAANGSNVGITVSSSDIDGGVLNYVLDSNPGGVFAINLTTGVVTLADNSTLVAGTPLTFSAHAVSVNGDSVSGTNVGASQTFTVDVVASQPVVDLDADNNNGTGIDYTTSFTEGGLAVAIADTDVTITEAGFTTLASATVTLTNAQLGDTLAVGSLAGLGITANTVSGGGVITVTLSNTNPLAPASFGNYQTALKAVTFSNTLDTPNTAVARTVTVTVDDGTNPASNAATATITVIATNDAPDLTPHSPAAATGYTENGAPSALLSSGAVTDADNPADFSGGGFTVAITAPQTGDQIVVLASSGFSVSGTSLIFGGNTIGDIAFASGSATVTNLTTDATQTVVNALVKAFGYQSSSEDPVSGSRTIQFTFDDGGHSGAGSGVSNVVSQTINVTAVNDAPTAVDDVAATQAEDTGAPWTLTGASLRANDFTGPAGVNEAGQTLSITGVSNFVGGTAIVNGSGDVVFTPTADFNGTASFDYTIQDDGAGTPTDVGHVTFTVTAVNDAPVLASGSATLSPSTISYVENASPTALLATDATIVDPDAPGNFAGGSFTVAITGATVQFEDQIVLLGSSGFTVSGTSLIQGGHTIGNIAFATGSATVTGLTTFATPTVVNQLLGAFGYDSTSDDPTFASATRDVEFTFNDGGNTGGAALASNTLTQTIDITAVNDAPVNHVPVAAQITPTDTDITFSPFNVVDNGISVSDVDAGTATVSLTVTHGTLTLSDTASLTFTGGSDGTDDVTMTFSGTRADINAALIDLTYHPDSGYSGTDTLTIVTDDGGNTGGGALQDTDIVHIAVTAAGTDPTLDLDGGAAGNDFATTFTEGGSAVPIADTDTAIVETANPGTLTSATITLVNHQANDVLTANTVALALLGITASAYNPATGELTLTSVTTNTAAEYQTALQQVSFSNPGDDPSIADRTVTVSVTDTTGTSNTALTTVHVAAVNDAPVLASVDATAAYTEDDAATVLSSTLTVSDPDNATLASATVHINNAVFGDVLGFSTAGTSITGSYDPANATLVLSGSDTLAHYQQVLRTVAFTTTGDTPTDYGLYQTRVLDWQLNDGTGTGTSWQTHVDYSAGDGPNSVALGDFDGDGKLDVATANINAADASNISVLLGNGSGTFGAAATFGTGVSGARSITTADVDGDGFLDLVAANTSFVSVLLGDGAGGFGASTNFLVGSTLTQVVTADLNGDGKLDIAVSNYDLSNVSVLLGDGAGGFSAPANYSTSAGGSDTDTLAAGDINGDGKLDLVAGNFGSGKLAILLGNGDGTYQPATFSTAGELGNPGRIAIADLNGDGKLDVVSSDVNYANINVQLGNGDGTFAAATFFDAGIGQNSVAIADINGDGKLDIVATSSSSFAGADKIFVLLGNGDGTFQTHQDFATGSDPRHLAIGDVNNTGGFDVVVANFASDNVSVLLNSGTDMSDIEHTTLTITATNDPPVNTVPAGPLGATEDTDLAITGLSVADPDIGGGNIKVTLSVLNGTIHVRDDVAGGLDPLDITGNDTPSVTLECDPAFVNVTLAALNGVVYHGGPDYNGPDQLTMVSDDLGSTGAGGPKTDTDTVAITVAAVNDAPVVDLDTTTVGNDYTTATYVYGAAGVPIAIGNVATAITDVDTATIASAVVTLTNRQAGDTLSISGALPGGISASFDISDSTKIIVTLTGAASHSAYATALQQVVFSNGDTAAFDPTARAITVVVSDGTDTSTPAAHTTIAVSPEAAPVAVADNLQAFERGGLDNAAAAAHPDPSGNVITGVTTTGQGGEVADTDADGPVAALYVSAVDAVTAGGTVAGTVGAAMSGKYGSLTVNSDGSYSYSLDNSNTDVQALVPAGATLQDVFHYTIKDAPGEASASAAITITISGADDLAKAFADTGSMSEDAAATKFSVEANDTLDPDSTALNTIAITGTVLASGPAGTGIVNGSVSAVTSDGDTKVQVTLGPAFQTLAAGETATVTVPYTLTGDTGQTSGPVNLVVTVNGANDVPVAVDDTPAQSVNFSMTEDAAATSFNVLANDTKDVDHTATNNITTGTVTASTSGSAAASISGADVTVGLTGAAPNQQIQLTLGNDFQKLAAGETATIDVSYTLHGDAADASTATMEVSVTGVNDAPVIDLLNTAGVQTTGLTATFTENGPVGGPSTPVSFLPQLTLADIDGTTAAGATVHLNNIGAGDVLTVNGGQTSGTLSGLGNIAFTASGSDITFTGSTTLANYQSALQLVEFNNTSQSPDTTARTFAVSVDDGQLANNLGTATATVNVVSVNDAPVNTVPGAQNSVVTDTDYAFTGPLTISTADVDAGSGTIHTTLSASHGDLTVTLGGATVFSGTNGTHTVGLSGTLAQINTALGTLKYNSDAGFTDLDTLTVLTNDQGNTPAPALSDTDTVSLNVIPKIWYIDDSVGAVNDATHFTTIAAFNTANAAASAADTPTIVYMRQGDNGVYDSADGVNLKNGQTLLGQGVDLTYNKTLGGTATLENGSVGQTPTIHLTAAGQGVTLAQNNTLKGFNIDTGTDGNAIGIEDSNGAGAAGAVGTLTVAQVGISGTGKAIDIDQGGTLAVSLSSIASTGSNSEGIQLGGIAGSLLGGSFAVTGTTSVTNADTTAIQVSNTAASASFNLGTSTTVNDTAVGSGHNGNGIDLSTGIGATNSFTLGNTSITTDGGFGLKAVSAGTLTFGATNSINATGGAAADITSTALSGATFGTVSSSGSANYGINLVNQTSGAFTASGGTIGTADTAAVHISGGTAAASIASAINSSNGNAVDISTHSGGQIDLTGTINHTSGGDKGIIVNANTGGTINFTGQTTIASTTANGVDLTNNTGATINFNAVGNGLDITTSSGTGFNATGGGTVNVANSGSGNTINSTNATALNVANTTIGASSLNFVNISAGNNDAGADPVNGIVLNTTGATGHLTITGDGGSANNSSGGTIQHTTGAGILLTSTKDVSLDQMNIHDTGGSGIDGTGVTNFTITNSTINNSGDGVGGSDATLESNIGFNHSASGNGLGNNISGTLTITGNTLTNAYFSGVDLEGSAGTITNANISNNTITSTTSQATSKGSGILVNATGDASGAMSIDQATINNNNVTGFPSGSGIIISGGNASSSGVAGHLGLFNDNTKVIEIANNLVQGVSQANEMASFGIAALLTGGNSGSRAQGNFNIHNNGTVANPVKNMLGQAIQVGNNGFSDMRIHTDNNVLAPHNINASQGIGGGNGVSGAGSAWTPHLIWSIDGNTISDTDGNGILAVGRQTSGTMDLEVLNNTVATPTSSTTLARRTVEIEAGNAVSTDDAVHLSISGNTVGAGLNGAGGIGVRKQGNVSTVNDFGIFDTTTDDAVPGHVLASNPTNAQVQAFIQALNPGAVGVDVLQGPGFIRDATHVSPLMAAAGGIAGSSPGETHLTQAQLDSVVAAAIGQWALAGASASQLAALHATNYVVGDLSGAIVGEQSTGQITIDVDAAGHGWFVDPTPNDNSEFTHAQNVAGTDLLTDPSNAAAGHLDLLTAVAHEMGHVLGLDDTTAASTAHDLMYIDLVDGERRLPDAVDVAQANAATSAQAAEDAVPAAAQAAAGSPIITGTSDNNSIDAGHGGNILFGGAGADKFVFGASTPLDAPTPAQVTHVADYSAAQSDTFDFSAITSAFHNSSVSDAMVVRAVEDASGKFATLQVDHIEPMALPSAPNWVSVAQLDGAHAGDAVNVWIDNHSVHLAQIHVDLLV